MRVQCLVPLVGHRHKIRRWQLDYMVLGDDLRILRFSSSNCCCSLSWVVVETPFLWITRTGTLNRNGAFCVGIYLVLVQLEHTDFSRACPSLDLIKLGKAVYGVNAWKVWLWRANNKGLTNTRPKFAYRNEGKAIVEKKFWSWR